MLRGAWQRSFLEIKETESSTRVLGSLACLILFWKVLTSKLILALDQSILFLFNASSKASMFILLLMSLFFGG